MSESETGVTASSEGVSLRVGSCLVLRGWLCPTQPIFSISKLSSVFYHLLMPSHSLAELAARPAQRSLVLVQPTGLLVAMVLLLGT